MPYKYTKGENPLPSPFDGWDRLQSPEELILIEILNTLKELVWYEREKNYQAMMKEIKEHEIHIKA